MELLGLKQQKPSAMRIIGTATPLFIIFKDLESKMLYGEKENENLI